MAAALYYCGIVPSVKDAVKEVSSARSTALKDKDAHVFLDHFQQFLD